MKGEGKFYYLNGEIFIGKWKNGLKDGEGDLIFDNNSTASHFKGQFINDTK